MKTYNVMDPSTPSAKYKYHGTSLRTAKATARRIAAETGLPVPIGYEVMTPSGTVKETGDAGIANPKV